MELFENPNNNLDNNKIYFDIFNNRFELDNYTSSSDLLFPFDFTLKDLVGLYNELDEDKFFCKIESNNDDKKGKKRKKKDFNIQYNNEEYKKKKSIKKCPNCNKIFYNGHALGGHLKYCNKKAK